jgi:hypothetical protein
MYNRTRLPALAPSGAFAKERQGFLTLTLFRLVSVLKVHRHGEAAVEKYGVLIITD